MTSVTSIDLWWAWNNSKILTYLEEETYQIIFTNFNKMKEKKTYLEE